MANTMTIAEKQYLAKILFTREKLDQKIVASRVHVSENTMSKWVKEFNWKGLRNRLLVSKETILSNLYEQLEELNTEIQSREPGKRYANNKESDTLIKLTASVRNLETDLAIADIVESGIRFIRFLQKVGTIEQVYETTEIWHGFIQSEMKR
jgi:transposase